MTTTSNDNNVMHSVDITHCVSSFLSTKQALVVHVVTAVYTLTFIVGKLLSPPGSWKSRIPERQNWA